MDGYFDGKIVPISSTTAKSEISNNRYLIEEITSETVSSGQHEQINEYLSKSSNSQALSSIRKRLLEISGLRCCTGYWNNLPIKVAIQNYNKNSALDYGNHNESATRLELILQGLAHIINYIDENEIHNNNSDDIIRSSQKRPCSTSIRYSKNEAL